MKHGILEGSEGIYNTSLSETHFVSSNMADEENDDKKPYLVIGSRRIDGPMYGFDLDGTLIVPRGKTKMPKSYDDWEWKYSWILPVLSHFKRIVIITNQKTCKSNSREMRTKMIEQIDKKMRKRGINATWLLSFKEGKMRKPCTGLFSLLKGVDLECSFYVGDAAGRKGDHSCCDRKLAYNLGIPFFTPEYLDSDIRQKSEKFKWGFMPTPPDNSNEEELDTLRKGFPKPIVVIMVGPPASGKSTLASTLNKPVLISRDELKTEARCLTMMRKVISDEKKKATNNAATIVIDNTNSTIDGRTKYIEMARETDLDVYCILMETEKAMTIHLALHREMKTGKHIPAVAINTYYSRYEEPEMDEGFTQIYRITPNISKETCKHVYN